VRHVFVETNWVVFYAAPAHHKSYSAIELLKRANSGAVHLYLPSICISEARRPILEKFQVKLEADRIRRFLLWGKQSKIIDDQTDETVRRVLDQMEGRVKSDLEKLDDVLANLKNEKGLEIFDLTQTMCERCSELSHAGLGLQPFDQSILAAVLVKAEELARKGIDQLAFCEADSDLQPWDKAGTPKDKLAKLYDERKIWVYQDFLLEKPEMRKGWPDTE
jgi:hypothetical protein